MFSVDKYFEENPNIEHAHSRTLWALLRFFSTHRGKTFSKQNEMTEDIGLALDLHPPLTNAAMSKALKKIENETLLIGTETYHLCKTGGVYGLYPAEKGMRAVYRLGDIYKDKKHLIISGNVIAFNLQAGKADLFVSTLKQNFDDDAFFAFDIRNDQLVYVLFDKSNKYGRATYDGFKNFKADLRDYMLGITN